MANQTITALVRACGYSMSGIRHAFQHERAIRLEISSILFLVPISLFLPVSRIEHLLLILSLLLVFLVELINSALEATVNRISLEMHPLSKQAKDMASAAVLIAVLMSTLCWIWIAGPVLIDFFGYE
ncbi:Diacylglycerol kinase [Gammaproteobacteria bacterium]